MSDIKPVPCHWCRSEVTIDDVTGQFWVVCSNAQCASCGPWRNTPEAAIATWDSLARVWRKPYDGDDPAPTDGTPFLGLLSNRWQVVMIAPKSVSLGIAGYAWWNTGGIYTVPYDPSHPERMAWNKYTLRLVGWQPLPPPPSDGDDA